MYWNVYNQGTLKERAGWIVTLDVLKFAIKCKIFNMFKLNSNIRCIEISLSSDLTLENVCWIVTLDVLKSPPNFVPPELLCWIVTLDVLK